MLRHAAGHQVHPPVQEPLLGIHFERTVLRRHRPAQTVVPRDRAGRLVLYFHPLKNGWELLEMMPEPRNYHTASLVGDEVFVIGGCDPHKTRSDEAVSSDSVFCYSAARRSWSKRTELPEARAFHGAAVLDDKIYVVGGRDQRGRYLDTVVEYSPMADGWSTVLRLPRCAMGSSVVSMDKRLWVLGGVSSPADSSFQPGPDDLLDDVFVLDVAHRTYTAGPPLPFPCAFAAATVTKRTLWFCGGLSPNDRGKLKSVSSTYVLEEGSWKFYDVLALNKHAFPAISFADSFVLSFGGATTSYEGSVDDCEVFFDGPGHGVLRLRPPPFPLAGHACVALPPVPLGHSKTDPPDVVDMWQRMCEGAKAL
ncbi:beta-scruin [Ixodes scapularis]|uniref:beta-scruin n=1 Tax=Ixodes scapularis TaxID=6945 RepID=UPI001A9DF02D|nr:beta-scruin [Ixodes scapularis]